MMMITIMTTMITIIIRTTVAMKLLYVNSDDGDDNDGNDGNDDNDDNEDNDDSEDTDDIDEGS